MEISLLSSPHVIPDRRPDEPWSYLGRPSCPASNCAFCIVLLSFSVLLFTFPTPITLYNSFWSTVPSPPNNPKSTGCLVECRNAKTILCLPFGFPTTL